MTVGKWELLTVGNLATLIKIQYCDWLMFWCGRLLWLYTYAHTTKIPISSSQHKELLENLSSFPHGGVLFIFLVTSGPILLWFVPWFLHAFFCLYLSLCFVLFFPWLFWDLFYPGRFLDADLDLAFSSPPPPPPLFNDWTVAIVKPPPLLPPEVLWFQFF